MIPKEILKKVKLIELNIRRLTNTIFSGEYHSAFKGRGMEFEEVREYQPGDDVRFIDWNVTARNNRPYIKVFREERELIVNLVVDISNSVYFGSYQKLKYEIIAEISAIIAFSAIKNNDRVGLLLFSDKIEKYIPPKKGKKHILYLIREILYHKQDSFKTDINQALEFLNRVQKKKSTIFLFSDFFADNYEKSLKVTSKNHDLISIVFNDISELVLPECGLIKFYDNELKQEILLDTSSNYIHSVFKNNLNNLIKIRNELFQKYEIDTIAIKTNEPYEKKLMNFFNKRKLR
ncbi:MAG TPA: DUF58 domain-containing protein [bacterium]|nr:DUF58 domain-containing protein [bacterium]HOL46684.1 DUF58 domain-containing protein [bacterium]HPQ18372.1 DUF58 domain-containing protein [bacterium]